MLEVENNHTSQVATARPQTLPEERARWPAEALTAYRQLMFELNAWCRRYDWPPGCNPGVAEAAVRQAYGS
jgi:hypothetical protein